MVIRQNTSANNYNTNDKVQKAGRGKYVEQTYQYSRSKGYMNRSGWNGKLEIDHKSYECQGEEYAVKLEGCV